MADTLVSGFDTATERNLQNTVSRQSVENRYRDGGGHDVKTMQSRPFELQTLHTQLTNIDSTIEAENQRLKKIKTSLDTSDHAKTPLLHLRSAMLRFVVDLETRGSD